MIRKVMTFMLVAILVAPVLAWAGHHSSHGKNIVETASSAGQFETLLAAAKAAGLAGALAGDGPFTVFAPTDEAFGALPAGTIQSLLKPENQSQLAEILKLHVVAGKVGSSALADGVALDMLNGTQARITAAEQGFTIEGARIVSTDIQASNGLVHVIDRVILPVQNVSQADVMSEIQAAISRGAPLFNEGYHGATVAIYQQTAERMMRMDSVISEAGKQRLKKGLRASRHAENEAAAAWQLRYALDDVMAMMVSR